MAGGHYHNFSDLLALPVKGHASLRDPVRPPVEHPRMRPGRDLFRHFGGRPLLHFPTTTSPTSCSGWNRPRTTRSAAHRHLLYRVASGSRVCKRC